MPIARARPYRQRLRAAGAAATARRIQDAAVALFASQSYDQVSLEAIATAANVTVITVLRHFGSKDALFAAVAQEQVGRAWRAIGVASTAAPESAVAVLVLHYERYGGMILRLLREAERSPAIQRGTAIGRAAHASWVEHTFQPALARFPPDERRLRQVALLTVTSVETWALLRHEQHLSRGATRAVLEHLVRAELEASLP